MNTNPASNGFTLIEVMTTLALSSVLIVGLVVIFTNVINTYRLDVALAQIQENARFAYQLMEWDLRSAGYQGCIDTNKDSTNVIANNAPATDLTNNAIKGYEVGTLAWQPTIDPAIATLDGVAKIGSDVFTVQTTSVFTQALDSAMASGGDTIRIADNSLGFSIGDLILITDCSNADLFQATAVNTSGSPVVISHAATGNSSDSLSKPYGTNAVIARYQAHTFYVAANGETNSAGNPEFSLFRQDINGNREEVVDGVNNMQLMYGERRPADLLRYVDASTAGLDISRVQSVRLGLLMQSSAEARTGDDDIVYDLPGDTVSPVGTTGATQTYAVDATLKQVFARTETLRNRL